ncbi:unnamed protein product [Caenorhabditis brenneri]
MYEQASHLQWKVIKYKALRRIPKREEFEDVRLILDESKRSLSVFCGSEEIEHAYFNTEVSKYPLLKIKSDHFYVLVNSQLQGFRLTFQHDDRNRFLTIMKKIAFISETPEKNHMNRSFTNTDGWGVEAEKRNTSFSQPLPYTHQQFRSVFRSPPKKSAMRNLAKSYKAGSHERSYMSPQQVSPVTYYSQPSRSPHSRPLSSASSVSSSISSAMSSLNEETSFFSYSQNSGNPYMSPRDSESSKPPFQNSQNSNHRKSSFPNSQASDHRESQSLNSQSSDHPKISVSRFKSTDHLQSSYRSMFSPVPLSLSPHSPEVLSQATSQKIMITTGVQTEAVIIDQLIEDPQFMNEFLSKMMNNGKFGDLVRTMRAHIRNLSPDTVDEFRKKTDDTIMQAGDSASSSGPPPLVHMSSDMENDVFV